MGKVIAQSISFFTKEKSGLYFELVTSFFQAIFAKLVVLFPFLLLHCFIFGCLRN